MSSEAPPTKREPGRRGKRGETRQLLIRVTLDLLRQEGIAALTTGRIAKAAGIAQPGFYAHFKSLDDCIESALTEVADDMREKISAARERAFNRFQSVEDVANVEAIRASYADTLEVLLADRAVAELMLRHRRDPTLLGGLMMRTLDAFRADLVADMWRSAQKFGFREQHRLQVEWWAEQVLALCLLAAESLLDGRYDRDLVIDGVTLNSFAIMRANIRWAGLGGPMTASAVRTKRTP